ncbi:MAG TPA: glucoamylase family protein [Pyrinomonadaceae bacterium]|nr:glucoamylase family protein [Pyrinomonadaceae bacterium]
MKNVLATLFGRFKRSSDPTDEHPISEELFSVERLEQYAQTLAAQHKVVKKKGRARLLPRLEDSGRKLVGAYKSLVEAVSSGRSLSPAAEWLIDNFHIVEEQLREIREDLPKSYYHELPKLAEGEFKDYPRIYALAIAFIAHTDSRLEPNALRRFIASYQSLAPLTIGELWALAISLRLALVENLRRLAIRIVKSREDREQADKLADRLLEIASRQPSELLPLLTERVGKREKLPAAFVVQLTQRLRDQDPAVTLVIDWLEKQLERQGSSIEQVIHIEHQRQASAQVTVGNIITSMRLLSTLDWRDFFESVSLVDPLLGNDPAGAYLKMDFPTRDRYRHVIERISKRTNKTELEVAAAAIEMASQAMAAGNDRQQAEAHVGYYLIDEGRPTLEDVFRYKPAVVEGLKRWFLAHPTLTYLGMLTLFTLLVTTVILVLLWLAGASPWLLIVAAFLALIPASDLALSLVNWDVTRTLEPRQLPKMDATEGIPKEARTMVVIPTIFFSVTGVRELVEKLEVHFLANQDDCIHFALLSDFPDANAEELPGDSALIDAALVGVDELNRRYSTGPFARFHLFHRRRRWNPSEGKWMGWERKRGKLQQFNRLARGARDTDFVVQTARPDLLQQTRYLITLDSDTQLPRDSARKLIGTAIHPLNRPRIDRSVNRVTYGYGILQPRVSVSLVSASSSRFARIFSGNTGIDPYTTAVSDVYQDLFGEGNYTGKGLYELDTFEAVLAERAPENTLLSHDLFESLFARAALVTDIELIDDYPARYDTYAKRQHRWTRGDWQLIRWLFPKVPDAHWRKVRNPLPLISRWKIFDNLRRSLVAPAMFLWLIAAWLIFPGNVLWWTLFIVVAIAFPVYLHVTTSLLIHPKGIPWTSHFWSVWGDIRTNTAQVSLSIIFLAHQAYLMSDAIIRTLYRVVISRRQLLEWVTAAQAESSSNYRLAIFLRFMAPAQITVGVAALLLILWRQQFPLVAAPFVVIWLVSPFVAYWISQPLARARPELPPEHLGLARLVGRRTWRFFETFVGTETNWLPPDNYQEDPATLAHRTSPTNIGLLLVSTVAAHDLGYLGTMEFVERQELTFATLERMRKFRGHLFNWYDTRTLEPLLPQYISTVDSGNFAGHLIALKQSCIELPDARLFEARIVQGLSDTLREVSEEASKLGAIRQRTEIVTVRELRDEIDSCIELISSAEHSNSLPAWLELLEALRSHLSVVQDIVNALAQEHGPENFADLAWWVGAMHHQVESLLREIEQLTPWALRLKARVLTPPENSDIHTQVRWQELNTLLTKIPSLAEIPDICDQALVQLSALQQITADLSADTRGRDLALNTLSTITAIIEAATGANDLQSRLAHIAQQCELMVEEMDFRFLLDSERKVFTIGYNVTELRPDNSYYDLLASEARLASFIAIAKGDVPQEHWFRLGRQLTVVDHGRALISWAGTMFEYLMPLLVMKNYSGTLLNLTYSTIVKRQIDYGYERGVPWGISESAYNVRDLHLNYQYAPFGVPGLGLKRGLIEDLVVSPYATILAAIIDPPSAMENLRRLEQEGALGTFGFYEAIDYTIERLPQNQRRVIIRAFMAHHQGMSLVALDNVLNNGRMEQRFHSDPIVQATELLLQERIPVGVPARHPRAEEVLSSRVTQEQEGLITRVYRTAQLETPHTQLLSNGTYSVMVTTAGAGYSSCGPNAVTRWREDVTRDHWGTFIYLRDVRSGAVWCAGYQPIQRRPQSYEVSFAEDKADFWRTDAGIITHLQILVSAEDNAEVRHVSVTNNSLRTREIELTSYAEVVLTPLLSDAAHPTFSNLFIETEFFGAENALLAHRRRRSSEDEPVWGVHVVVADGEQVGAVQYETDRSRFLGRGHTPADPLAIVEDRPLSNTTGAVLDPVFSLRRRVRIKPTQTAHITFTTAVANSREKALQLADKYHDASIFDREVRLAWTKAQVEMSHLSVSPEEAHLFQLLAGRVIYSDPSLRPRPHVLALNTRTQSSLWPYGISGDLPILLVRINKAQDLSIVRKLLRAHEYLHYKGLRMDLIILNDHPPSYLQSLHDELQAIIRTSGLHMLQEKPAGVFLRRSDLMPEADRILLHAVARVVIVTERGLLEEQLERRSIEEPLPPPFAPRMPSQVYPEPTVALPELSFFNGVGGFNEGGREYVIVLGEGQWTPAPWSNIISNRNDFGFLVTENGGGYTWSINSRENRLTPWSNDAVCDPPSEIVYLRDEDTGTLWSPTPLPIREPEPYSIRHGQGYTVFEHTSHGISQELLQFVPLEDSVKISLLRLRNRTSRSRRISVTFYNELVLGVHRSLSAPYIITELDTYAGTIFAHNPFNNEFAHRVAFAALSEKITSATCDRKEFLGRNGSPARPEALLRTKLSNRAGAGLDPCAALQTVIELEPGEAREVIFLFGQGNSREEADELVNIFKHSATVNEAFEEVLSSWDGLLKTIEVRTPDAAMNMMLNRWLLYQTLSCRIWSRSAFYQSGGAYGFRDQLQDVMALVYSRPEVAREQITRAAQHQFKEGDVLHWWHPPSSRGVRTRFSDDLLWLPFVVGFYITVTGDTEVLDEQVPFLEGPLLGPEELEVYMQPVVSSQSGTVFEHCVRAIDRSMKVGSHGLPLMGSGDWNDGMNRIGHKGKGESVWVGWFLYSTLARFTPLCEARKQKDRADRYRKHMDDLKVALEEHGWDGDWYRRAYFDDGTPLGSVQNDECRIDSIVQSWGVMSRAAEHYRAVRAMAAVEEYLIRRGDGLVILFNPPFDKGKLDPGYIKGYVPGVRENGGQYTHAALWTLIAYAMLGDGERAGELFSLLNPINHASTRAGLHKYKVEPYAAAGDVYAVPPHTGRGGWTWYTGSASWMYRAGLESILGFGLRADRLIIDPCVPRWWREFEIVYRLGETTYKIKFENPLAVNRGIALFEIDGESQTGNEIRLKQDGLNHMVRVVLGERPQTEISPAETEETHEEQTQ